MICIIYSKITIEIDLINENKTFKSNIIQNFLNNIIFFLTIFNILKFN